jgi:hypothetical protein
MDFRLDPDDELDRQELRRFATCVPDPRYQADDRSPSYGRPWPRRWPAWG